MSPFVVHLKADSGKSKEETKRKIGDVAVLSLFGGEKQSRLVGNKKCVQQFCI